ncbi:valyl-trna synthetase [Cystoisospora suis]|uniref:valine--tRNA ligase n=1 Tax=Cystoisospora suis TaxID=483139 RepID=A0A2C6KF94_9APIC|nr:valyl-trna synthetase [Cystoisospora suis]
MRVYLPLYMDSLSILSVFFTSCVLVWMSRPVCALLFFFSVFGWPDDTGDMRAFFPGTLLETGHDILFFWVARMVMMSLELTKKLPFNTVFLHAMVRDAHGQKMSKSKGNVIDPLEVIHGISLAKLQEKLHQGNLPEKEVKRAEEVLKKEFPNGIEECGCDALRIGLLAYTRQGRNVNLDLNRVVGYRHFCNKLWNATKFAIDKFHSANSILASCADHEGEENSLDGIKGSNGLVACEQVNGSSSPKGKVGCIDTSAHANGETSESSFKPGGVYMGGIGGKTRGHGKGRRIGVTYHELQWVDRWILHRLSITCAEVNKYFREYAFSEVVTAIFNFFLYDLCDYYLELTKQRLAVCTPGEKSASSSHLSSLCALEVLYVCLDRGLRLLHPLCPFITEELYQRLPANETKADSICIADYPQPVLQWMNFRLDTDMELFKNVVSRFRSLQAALDIPPKIKPAGFVLLTPSSGSAGAACSDSLSSLGSFLKDREAEIATMAKMSSVKLRMPDEGAPGRCVSDVVNGSITIFLSVEEGVNLAQTLEKMNKKKANLEKMIQGYEKKEAMPSYEDKVPLEVREQNAQRKTELKSELSMLLQAIENMKRLACE